MSGPDSNVARLQRWFAAVITAPAGVRAGLASEEAQRQIALRPEELETIVLPSRQLSAEDRLAVYHNAYFARLLEALRAFLPCLSDTLGDELFAQFAVAYLHRYPSQTYTLHRLADQFVRFLEETRPGDVNEEQAEWSRFWIDLARLELAIDRVFDGPGPERMPKPDADRIVIDASDHWPDVRLKFVEGFTLLEFDFPVSELYTSWKHGDKPVIPQPAKEYIALFRRGFVVRRATLSKTQFFLLQSIAQGVTVGQSIESVAKRVDDIDSLAANLARWFQQWVADEVIVGVATESRTSSPPSLG